MKKLITTFAILVVVIIAGMSALVMLVNPNDFKHYMVQQVEKRSGYQLKLTGDLRWHVWPKLSILSGPMSLTAPGAKLPAVTAENMRLDVALLPLLSHQLHINQILINHAVIQETPDAQAEKLAGQPIAPDSSPSRDSFGHWSLDIARINVVNSLFIWQDPQGEQLNFRKFTLSLHQEESRSGHYHLATEITRNQQTLSVNLRGQLDARMYPQKALLTVDQGDYQLQGVSLPTQGISGQAHFSAQWLPFTSSFSLDHFTLQANESDFSGQVNGQLAPHLRLALNLHANNANFDQLLTHGVHEGTANDGQVQPSTPPAHTQTPVVVAKNDHAFPDWLSQSQISTELTADQARWHGVGVKQLHFSAQNQFGVMQLSQLKGSIADGQFAINGKIDFRTPQPQVELTTSLQRIPLTLAMPLLQLPPVLKGKLSLDGHFSGQGLQANDMLTQWQGSSTIGLLGLDIPQMNVQQMVIDAVTRASDRVQSDPALHPVAPDMQGAFNLAAGKLTLQSLQGDNAQVSLSAQGTIDFAQRNLDLTFNLLTRGWKGDSKMIAALANQAIPLRFYGPWHNLQYSLSVDRLLKDSLKGRFQRWLNEREHVKHSD